MLGDHSFPVSTVFYREGVVYGAVRHAAAGSVVFEEARPRGISKPEVRGSGEFADAVS